MKIHGAALVLASYPSLAPYSVGMRKSPELPFLPSSALSSRGMLTNTATFGLSSMMLPAMVQTNNFSRMSSVTVFKSRSSLGNTKILSGGMLNRVI